jgi:hypothetical protein
MTSIALIYCISNNIELSEMSEDTKSVEESDSGIQISPVPVIILEEHNGQSNQKEDITCFEISKKAPKFHRYETDQIIASPEVRSSPSSTPFLNRNDESHHDAGYQVSYLVAYLYIHSNMLDKKILFNKLYLYLYLV